MAILTTKAHSPGLRHVRKTVAFTGAAGLGEAGTVVPVFTTTGRVMVVYQTVFCSETLVSASNLGTISLGITSNVTLFTEGEVFTVGAGSAAVGEWMTSTPTVVPGGGASMVQGLSFNISEDIIIDPLTQNITDGTLIIDCWYLPITDNGALAAA